MSRKCSIAAVVLVFFCAAGLSAAEGITYNKHVAPIVYKNCAACHRPGEIAPMSLMTYKDARPWGKAIREKVVGRVMPPWHADPKYGHFNNDRRLAQKDIDTIVAWVDGGLREGDAADLPPAPKYADGWNIGQPDAVFSLPEEYSVPAEGVVAYQNFTVSTNFTEDHWIQAAEIRPGNRAVVHHVIVYAKDPDGSTRPPSGLQIQNIGAPEGTPRPPANRSQNPSRWFLVGTAPGDGLGIPPGTAKLVKAGSQLIFQMHYTPNGSPAKDRTRVGLVFSKQPPEYDVKTAGVSNGRFAIPPGEANFRVESAAVFTEDVRLWSLFPHMHLRGKSFDYRLIYPDGKSQLILSVPKYDFNWQSSFDFAEPISVPKGSRLECTAYFDNSTGNRFNPDPNKEVHWGDQTWEEMMIGWINYSVENQKVTVSANAGKSRSE